MDKFELERGLRSNTAIQMGMAALKAVAEYPITDPANMDAVNMQRLAKTALDCLCIDTGTSFDEVDDWSEYSNPDNA